MKVFKIVTHDGKEFVCKNVDELYLFTANYRRLEVERIKRDFPQKQLLVDHVEIMEMTNEEYAKIPASTESVKYFGWGGG